MGLEQDIQSLANELRQEIKYFLEPNLLQAIRNKLASLNDSDLLSTLNPEIHEALKKSRFCVVVYNNYNPQLIDQFCLTDPDKVEQVRQNLDQLYTAILESQLNPDNAEMKQKVERLRSWFASPDAALSLLFTELERYKSQKVEDSEKIYPLNIDHPVYKSADRKQSESNWLSGMAEGPLAPYENSFAGNNFFIISGRHVLNIHTLLIFGTPLLIKKFNSYLQYVYRVSPEFQTLDLAYEEWLPKIGEYYQKAKQNAGSYIYPNILLQQLRKMPEFSLRNLLQRKAAEDKKYASYQYNDDLENVALANAVKAYLADYSGVVQASLLQYIKSRNLLVRIGAGPSLHLAMKFCDFEQFEALTDFMLQNQFNLLFSKEVYEIIKERSEKLAKYFILKVFAHYQTVSDSTALCQLAHFGIEDGVALAATYGFDLEQKDLNGKTSLQVAVEQKQKEFVVALLRRFVNPSAEQKLAIAAMGVDYLAITHEREKLLFDNQLKVSSDTFDAKNKIQAVDAALLNFGFFAKGLSQKLAQQDQEIASLRSENQALKNRLATLEQHLNIPSVAAHPK